MQDEGKTRYVGISGYPLQALISIVQRTPVDSVLSYCRYNLLIDDMDSVLLPVAKGRGIGIINASPLHMGMLTEQGGPDWHPALQSCSIPSKQPWLSAVNVASTSRNSPFDFALIIAVFLALSWVCPR